MYSIKGSHFHIVEFAVAVDIDLDDEPPLRSQPLDDDLDLPPERVASDDEPAPPQDVLAFAAKLGGFAMPPAVAWDDPALSPTLRRFYESNKRIDSRGTREALAWQPRFPSYREGLRDLLR